MTTDEMLQRIATLLHFDGRWHARASGQQRFYTANTPREAMEGALRPPVEQPQARRRKSFSG